MLEDTFQNLKTKTLESLLQLGRCCETGEGVTKDEIQAVKWYRMAAEQGLVDACFELAKCYRFGIGVRKNRTIASKWLHRSSDQGHKKAMVLLGMHYLNSYEGEYNPRIAVKLFRKAADLGDAWGMYHLAECYEKGDGVKKDLDNAFLWFCRAVVTSPEDERLYQSVQDYIFDPNLKQYRENIIGNKHCIR